MVASSPTERALARARTFGLLLLAAGCSTFGGGLATRTSGPAAEEPPPRTQPVRPVANLAGYSTAYREGHADGCDSARSRERRSAKRYASDTDYMMGWNDGKMFCRAR